MSPEIEWRRLRADQLREMAKQDALVILPLGSIEQHGPHLPVSTDSTIAESICVLAAALVPPEVPLLVMPTQSVGKVTFISGDSRVQKDDTVLSRLQ